MENLTYNPEKGVVGWTVGGKPGGMKKEQMDFLVGISKEKGTAGRVPAEIQTIEYYAKNLTGGDRQRAFQLKQLSKADPQAAFARIYAKMQDDNAEKLPEEQMTNEEMRETAWGTVEFFQQKQLDKLFGQKEKGMPDDSVEGAPKSKPKSKPKGDFNLDDPSTYNILWGD
jgi:hypothetical protein